MTRRVVVTKQAEREMQAAFNWWAEHRSKKQADQWYTGFAKTIGELSENPERHGTSREIEKFGYEIRDLLFGIGRRLTHRAVFTIRDDEVVVLTVRHVAQRDISPDDLGP